MPTLKRIHVNRQKIAQNKKLPMKKKQPVITIKTSKINKYCYSAIVDGKTRIVYSPDKPLSCGAVAWMETYGTVTTDDGTIIF